VTGRTISVSAAAEIVPPPPPRRIGLWVSLSDRVGKRCGDEPQAREERRHQDRAQALAGAEDDRAEECFTLLQTASDRRNDEHPVEDRLAEKRDESDRRRHREREVRDRQADDAADQGERDVEKDDERVPDRLERRKEEQEREDQGQRDDEAEARHGPLLILELPRPT